MPQVMLSFFTTIGHVASTGTLRMHAVFGASDPFGAATSPPVPALMNVHAARATTLAAQTSQLQLLLALAYGALQAATPGPTGGALTVNALIGGSAQASGAVAGPDVMATQFAPAFDRALALAQSAPFSRVDATLALTVAQISSSSSRAPIYAPVISGELSVQATTSDEEAPLSAASPRIELLQ